MARPDPPRADMHGTVDRPRPPRRPDPAPVAKAPTGTSTSARAAPALVALALATSVAHADWRGGVDGGVALGEDRTTRVHAYLVEDERPLTHRLDADWTRRADTGSDWSLGYVPRRYLGPRTYAFAEAGLRGAPSLRIDSEARALVGLGARLAPAPDVTLFAEVGAGAVRTDLDRPCEDVDGAAPGDPCAGVDEPDEAEVSGLGALRGGASAALADRLRLSATTGLEARSGAVELGASASAALAVPGGTASVTVRTRRVRRDGADDASVTDTFFGYSLGF